jgi:hypothetical protein
VIGTVILWLVAAFAGFWTIMWLLNMRRTFGHFLSVVDATAQWGLFYYFLKHPGVSRLHLLWAAPIVFVVTYVGSLAVGWLLNAARRSSGDAS